MNSLIKAEIFRWSSRLGRRGQNAEAGRHLRRQRGPLPSFWANRFKVSEFGRDRAVELHRSEVNKYPQFGRRIHVLSGKRLLCHCKTTEKCHAENLQDLFRKLQPHAFDPARSERPPLSIELNILAKGREEREDSEEAGLEDAEANAPHGWPGTGMPVGIGSGVERRLFDGQGLCSPGAWALEDRNYPSAQLWRSPASLTCSSRRYSSCQNSLWVVTGSRRSVRMLGGS